MENFGKELTKEEKEKLLSEKIEAMKKRNELLRKRYEEIEADKKLADKYSASVQINEVKPYVMKPPRPRPEKVYNLSSSDGVAEEEINNSQEFLLSKQRLLHNDGPPPDPSYRFLADPDRDTIKEANPDAQGDKDKPNRKGARNKGKGRGRGRNNDVDHESGNEANSENFRGRGRGRGRRGWVDRGKGRGSGWEEISKISGNENDIGDLPKCTNYSDERDRTGFLQVDRNEDKIRGRGGHWGDRGRGRKGDYDGGDRSRVSTGWRAERKDQGKEEANEFTASTHSEFSLRFRERETHERRGRGGTVKRRRQRGRQRGRGQREVYEEWKAERDAIDEARITRARSGDGEWKREWDMQKIEHEKGENDTVYHHLQHYREKIEAGETPEIMKSELMKIGTSSTSKGKISLNNNATPRTENLKEDSLTDLPCSSLSHLEMNAIVHDQISLRTRNVEQELQDGNISKPATVPFSSENEAIVHDQISLRTRNVEQELQDGNISKPATVSFSSENEVTKQSDWWGIQKIEKHSDLVTQPNLNFPKNLNATHETPRATIISTKQVSSLNILNFNLDNNENKDEDSSTETSLLFKNKAMNVSKENNFDPIKNSEICFEAEALTKQFSPHEIRETGGELKFGMSSFIKKNPVNSFSHTNDSLITESSESETTKKEVTEVDCYLKYPLKEIKIESLRNPNDEAVWSSVKKEDSDDEAVCSSVKKEDSDDETVCSSVKKEDSDDEAVCSSVKKEDSDDEAVCSSVKKEDSDDEAVCSSVKKEDSDDEAVCSSVKKKDSDDEAVCSSVKKEDPDDEAVCSSVKKENSDDEAVCLSVKMKDSDDEAVCSSFKNEDSDDEVVCSSVKNEDSDNEAVCSSVKNEDSVKNKIIISNDLKENRASAMKPHIKEVEQETEKIGQNEMVELINFDKAVFTDKSSENIDNKFKDENTVMNAIKKSEKLITPDVNEDNKPLTNTNSYKIDFENSKSSLAIAKTSEEKYESTSEAEFVNRNSEVKGNISVEDLIGKNIYKEIKSECSALHSNLEFEQFVVNISNEAPRNLDSKISAGEVEIKKKKNNDTSSEKLMKTVDSLVEETTVSKIFSIAKNDVIEPSLKEVQYNEIPAYSEILPLQTETLSKLILPEDTCHKQSNVTDSSQINSRTNITDKKKTLPNNPCSGSMTKCDLLGNNYSSKVTKPKSSPKVLSSAKNSVCSKKFVLSPSKASISAKKLTPAFNRTSVKLGNQANPLVGKTKSKGSPLLIINKISETSPLKETITDEGKAKKLSISKNVTSHSSRRNNETLLKRNKMGIEGSLAIDTKISVSVNDNKDTSDMKQNCNFMVEPKKRNQALKDGTTISNLSAAKKSNSKQFSLKNSVNGESEKVKKT